MPSQQVGACRWVIFMSHRGFWEAGLRLPCLFSLEDHNWGVGRSSVCKPKNAVSIEDCNGVLLLTCSL